jgi:hypothetical protein
MPPLYHLSALSALSAPFYTTSALPPLYSYNDTYYHLSSAPLYHLSALSAPFYTTSALPPLYSYNDTYYHLSSAPLYHLSAPYIPSGQFFGDGLGG